MNTLLTGACLKRAVLLRRRKIIRLAGRIGIESVWLVGSVARGEATRTSDIDFYVESDDPLTLDLLRGWLTMFGRPVDIIHPQTLLDRGEEFAGDVTGDAIAIHKDGTKPPNPFAATSKD